MNIEELKASWQVENKPEIQVNIWNGMAKRFHEKPLPSFEDDRFLRFLSEKQLLNSNAKVLDIGCGAGTYSLAIAPKVQQVIGIDISPDMIGFAKGKAEELGYANAKFFCADWSNFPIQNFGFEKEFDVAFVRMSPAIYNFETFEKFVQCAKKHCVFVSNTRRKDKITDEAFYLIGIENHRQKREEEIANVFSYLWLNGYSPSIQYVQETWNLERTPKEALEWCKNRAKLQKELTAEDEAILADFIENVAEDGIIHEEVNTTIVTIDFSVEK